MDRAVLEFAQVRASDDAAQYDHDLICTECGDRLCTVEDGDTLLVLADVVTQHRRVQGHTL